MLEAQLTSVGGELEATRCGGGGSLPAAAAGGSPQGPGALRCEIISIPQSMRQAF